MPRTFVWHRSRGPKTTEPNTLTTGKVRITQVKSGIGQTARMRATLEAICYQTREVLDAMRISLKWMSEHPQDLDHPVVELVFRALTDAFPCARTAPAPKPKKEEEEEKDHQGFETQGPWSLDLEPVYRVLVDPTVRTFFCNQSVMNPITWSLFFSSIIMWLLPLMPTSSSQIGRAHV